jgi:GAF domain-containing protein
MSNDSRTTFPCATCPCATCPHPDVQAVSGPVASAYLALAQIVLGAQSLGAVMLQVAELAREVVPGARDVSITLIDRARPRTVVFTGFLAPALDERQYRSGRGPGMDAATTGQTIAINDTATDTQYEELSHQTHRAGVGHSLSIPLPTLRASTGAITVYGHPGPGPFSEQARAIAAGFAGHAAVTLANAALYAAAVQEVMQMKEALTSRAVIEQAKGILMRDHFCASEQAFDILRDISSRTSHKLRDVAYSITRSTL